MSIIGVLSRDAEIDRNKLYIKECFKKQDYEIILGIVGQISEEIKNMIYNSRNRMIQLEQEIETLREENKLLQQHIENLKE